MGVTGLWQIVEPAGRPVNVESLRGKVLAVDVSIWLHQLVKGFRDKDGNPLPNAHLLGVFHRVCKLLHYGIKPVFVFDGGVPELKRQTMILRRKRKIQAQDKSEISRQKILSNFLRQEIQRQTKQALPPTLRMESKIKELSSPTKSISPTKKASGSPVVIPVPTTSKAAVVDVFHSELQSFREKFAARDLEGGDSVENGGGSESDDSDEYRASYGMDYSDNFSAIVSSDFDALPLETQHEVLFEMQESRKMNSWGKLDKMPQNLQDFSSYQMDRLVKRRFLQKKIQSVQQEMGQRHIHVQNLDDLLKMDYSFDGNSDVIGSKEKGCLLVKTSPTKKSQSQLAEEPKPGSSSSVKIYPEIITIDDYDNDGWISSGGSSEDDVKEIGRVKSNPTDKTGKRTIPEIEEDEQLALAISMSLMEDSKSDNPIQNRMPVPDINNASVLPNEINRGPKQVDIDESQRSLSEKSPRSNQTILKPVSTSASKTNVIESFQSSQSSCFKFLGWVGFSENVNTSPTVSELATPKKVSKTIETSESDSDFEAVEEHDTSVNDDQENNPETKLLSTVPDTAHKSQICSPSSEIVTIKLNEVMKEQPKDDIFADIFMSDQEVEDPKMELNADNQSDGKIIPADEEDVKWDSDPDIDNLFENEQNPDLKELEAIDVVAKKLAHEEFLRKFIKPSVKETNLSSSASCTNETITRTLGNITSRGIEKSKVKVITAEYMQAQEKLNAEQEKLQSTRGNQERVATSISDQMSIETQELLSLFGIPYIVSPMEAESQCAFLDTACLTEGTITDDSDIWLFNGRRVYKNFYSSAGRQLEFYQQADIIKILNLDRDKLVLLAMLMGGDYNEGIEGVGPVTALELISEFPTNSIISFDSLVKFREWWEQAQNQKANTIVSKVKEKLRKLKLNPGFPSKAVYEAYMNPTIDTSTEPFRWGNPDLDSIRSYTKDKFGWEQSKCDGMLLPLMKNLRCQAEQSKQLTMDRFVTFGRLDLDKPYKRKKGSKRLHTAVKKLKRLAPSANELNLSSDSDSNFEETEKPKLSPSTKSSKSSKRSKEDASESCTSPKSGTSSSSVKIRIPQPNPVIPQKVQEATQRNINKQKAIKMLKTKDLKK